LFLSEKDYLRGFSRPEFNMLPGMLDSLSWGATGRSPLQRSKCHYRLLNSGKNISRPFYPIQNIGTHTLKNVSLIFFKTGIISAKLIFEKPSLD